MTTKKSHSAKSQSFANLKVALVCDWLTNPGGAEKVLLSIHQLFPKAPIYTSQYNPKGIDWFKDADVRTGWLQIFPSKMRRLLSPLRQRYFSHLDLSDYDLIISVTGAEAKSVKFRPSTKTTADSQQSIHLCYCHVPTQYYWQMYDDYVKNPGFGPFNFLVRPLFKVLVGRLRRADYASAQLPTKFITISHYAASQIKQYYHRDATIIPPPVAVENFATAVEKTTKSAKNSVDNSTKTVETPVENSPTSNSSAPDSSTLKDLPPHYFLNFSRQVSWKRLDLAIEACQKTGNHLVLVGDGPEHNTLVKLANSQGNLVTFLPATDQSHLKAYLEHADAFIFPSLEPFGIAPVEALSAGVPVIAYGKGGAKDYVKDGKNGLLFGEQTAESLARAIKKFQKLPAQTFRPSEVSQSVAYYSEERFQTEIKEFVHAQLKG